MCFGELVALRRVKECQSSALPNESSISRLALGAEAPS